MSLSNVLMSSSRVKIIKIKKNYLRSSTSQRLNCLAILYIKKNMIELEHIHIYTIISDFVSKNAPRNYFV
jgi:hypothetical protein